LGTIVQPKKRGYFAEKPPNFCLHITNYVKLLNIGILLYFALPPILNKNDATIWQLIPSNYFDSNTSTIGGDSEIMKKNSHNANSKINHLIFRCL
jgi:hypothetical protein